MSVGTTAGAVCLAFQMTLAMPFVCAASQQSSSTNNSSSKPKTPASTNQPAKQMNQLAIRLLQHVDQARHAISDNQKQSATTHINQALANWNQLSSFAKGRGCRWSCRSIRNSTKAPRWDR